ncbi:hypothetical protein J7F03_20725 [Streptomyces sp. ISL-43]|uniref:hypothetical protein n=1 Tax=Streptomyces sp. ISL-43 TaxID=2819183 RepID=UPI001BEA7E6A|nr:hypothetical protein [Streptomyces sp. ISL-43]MBT2449468.1 hypothetical protein [Streptomyces sp. ISL-43]
MRTHHTITALAAAGLLALTGCSSSDPKPAPVDAPAPTSSPSPKVDPARVDLEKAVRAYSAAYFKPDGAAAYAALSKRCQDKAGDADVFTIIVDTAAKAYGKQEIQTLTIDQLAGDLARVSYTYSVPKLNQTSQPWAREAGTWKYDGC